MNRKQLNLLMRKNTMLNERKLEYIVNATNTIAKNNIEGDIVECGVWMGGSAALIADTLLQHKQTRMIHLLDSFDDPHEPLPVDGPYLIKLLGGMKRAKGRLQTIKGFYDKVTKGKGPGDPRVVYNLLVKSVGYPKEKIKFHKGWFQNTVASVSESIDKISFLIIDCDLYAPTKLCLEYLCPKVVPNGLIFIDDYPTLDGCKKAVDDYVVKHKIRSKFIRVPGAGCIAWLVEGK